MRIRPATPDDAAGINAVRNASWQGAYGAHLPDGYWAGYDSAAATARFAAMISAGRTRVLVAQAERIVGFVFFGANRDEDLPAAVAEIYAIYVHPDAWSTGAGRALMDAALAALGDVPVVLWVLTANERARRFYARAGFVLDGAEKEAEMPGGNLPELRYRRALVAVEGGRQPEQ
ncbi:MAG TPA: GNAT family N-acetyltransferase [Jatrophihabitans sp.]|jgi:ribosomal protein S18 acetylase RimI-like enzyme